MRASSGLEKQKHWCGLQHQLFPVSNRPTLQIFLNGLSYRLENTLPIRKVQCPKHQSRLILLIPPRPAPSQQIPLRLEIMAQPAPESCVQRGQEYCDRVVPRSLGDFGVGPLVELDGFGDRGLLGVVVFEAVAGRFLRAEGEGGQEGCQG